MAEIGSRRGFFALPRVGERPDDWFTAGRVAVFLGLLILAMFPEVVLGKATFYYRDFGIYSYPLAHFQRESFWQGQLPLWNPLNNCGIPFLAQWNTMVLYPPALFYLLLPLSWALGMFCLLHLFLGGMGMWWLASRWTGNRLAGTLAAVAFAFNGLTWNALMWSNVSAALGWMPWVVGSVVTAWRNGGRWMVGAAVLGALQMLTGAVELILLTWGLLGVLWLGEEFSLRANQVRQVAKTGGRFGVVVVLVVGLTAMQLLPFFELLSHSQRSDTVTGADWAMPGLGWGNLLVPLFHCYRSFQGVFVQYDQYWTSSYYLGIAVVALAVMGVLRIRERRVRLLATLAILSAVFALGENAYLYSWCIDIFPGMAVMRFPIKFVMLIIFLVPLLAAYGLSHFRAASGTCLDTERRAWGVTTGVIATLVVMVLACAWFYPMPRDDWPATLRNGCERLIFLGLVSVLLLVLSKAREPWRQGMLGIALIGLLWLDLRTHAPNLNPTVPLAVYEPGLVAQEPVFQHGPPLSETRTMVSYEALERMRHTALDSPAQDYLGRRLALYGNCNLLDSIPKLNGFYPLYIKEADEIMAFVECPGGEKCAGLIDFLNVSRITAPKSLMEWEARPDFMPRVSGGQRPLFLSREDTLGVLSLTNFAPRAVVLLPLAARAQSRTTKASNIQIVSSVFEPRRVEVLVEADADGWVTYSQSFYAPWRAFVDGVPADLWRSNHAFQSVQVPPGRHRVVLIYQDKTFQLGAAISGMTILGCAGWILITRRGRGAWRVNEIAAPRV